jgi:hypothetical protein
VTLVAIGPVDITNIQRTFEYTIRQYVILISKKKRVLFYKTTLPNQK